MSWEAVVQVETLEKLRLPANHAVAAPVPPSIFLVPVDNKHEERSTKYSPQFYSRTILSPLHCERDFEELAKNGRQHSLLVFNGLEKFLNEFA